MARRAFVHYGLPTDPPWPCTHYCDGRHRYYRIGSYTPLCPCGHKRKWWQVWR